MSRARGVCARFAAALTLLAPFVGPACLNGQIDGYVGPPIDPAGPRSPSADPISAGSPMCRPPAGDIVDRAFTPKLFLRGADPSADADCAITNPERGFFSFQDLRSLRGQLRGGDGESLIYGKALLTEYRERELDAAVLDQIRASFATVRKAGLKVLPRFYYADSEGAPLATTDRVLGHIAQLAPVLRENADVIAALHAGFLGFWGEWHAQRPLPAADRQRVLEALLGALPAQRMVLVRRPSFKRDAFGGPLDVAAAFGGTPLSRLGHLNDCFLASADDQGTYANEAERTYAIRDSNFTAVGGETCGVNPPRTDCTTALTELGRHHWSFINGDYNEAVLNGWQRNGCAATVACRLGYRFVVRGHLTPRTVRRGPLSMTVAVTNDGWARAYNARPLLLVLTGPKTVALPTGVDARAFPPGIDVNACLAVTLPSDLPAGSYKVGLALPDPEPTLAADIRYNVRLVGGVTWDPTTGINALDATITVTD